MTTQRLSDEQKRRLRLRLGLSPEMPVVQADKVGEDPSAIFAREGLEGLVKRGIVPAPTEEGGRGQAPVAFPQERQEARPLFTRFQEAVGQISPLRAPSREEGPGGLQVPPALEPLLPKLARGAELVARPFQAAAEFLSPISLGDVEAGREIDQLILQAARGDISAKDALGRLVERQEQRPEQEQAASQLPLAIPVTRGGLFIEDVLARGAGTGLRAIGEAPGAVSRFAQRAIESGGATAGIQAPQVRTAAQRAPGVGGAGRPGRLAEPPTPAAAQAAPTGELDLDATLRAFEADQAARRVQGLIDKGKPAYIKQRLIEIRADVKDTGFPLNLARQREILSREYDSLVAKQPQPTVPARAAATELPIPGVGRTTEAVTPPPVSATRAVRAIQEQGAQNPAAIPPAQAKVAHVEFAAPDGPRPPEPPRPGAPPGATPPPKEPSDYIGAIAQKALKGDRPDQTLLRLHEAAINNAQRRTNIITNDGNGKLKALGIGVSRGGQRVPRTQDIPVLDELLEALHNPSKVATGEITVPPRFQAIYKELRELTDWEEAARLDFDPDMATVTDYFYRGWKPPEGFTSGVQQGGPLVRTPAFKKPRVNATYREMREAGFEPLFWNPYQQWAISRMQGVKYREQMELVDWLKHMGDDLIKPHDGGPIPKGWRVPEVGPAFEGKPFATADATGQPATMYTRRWIVPDRVANTMENIYGKRPNIQKLTVGKISIDPLSVIDFLTFLPKRVKLYGSLFQQVDFLTRAGAGSWTRLADSLESGRPLSGLKALAQYPQTAGTILRANFSPGFRQTLRRQLDDATPLVQGRPGLSLKSISEAGLSTIDPTIFPADMDKLVRQVANETGILKKGLKYVRMVGDLEGAMRRGLFEGVYPAAMITDIRNNVAPMFARMYPKLNDQQLAGAIATQVNKKYSSIPASQSVFQNRVVREVLRRTFFSIGESEGLLRQASGTVRGPYKAFWAKHFIGTYLFLIATANLIHYASTGETLPKERYVPIAKDNWGPLPFGYNTRFAAPTIPLKGRGGTELTLDIVGQMDTALRVLDPTSFASARTSVPVRALLNQQSGTDFFGAPIDDVGPGGIVSRTAQLAQDFFSPIGVGQFGEALAREFIPGAEKVIPEGETRLGLAGQAIQATGLNLRAASNRELRDAGAQQMFGVSYNELEPYQRQSVREEPSIKAELLRRREKEPYTARIDVINTQRDETMTSIVEMRRTGKMTQQAAVNAYFDAEAEAAIRKDEATRNFGVEFESTEEDPILSFYYGIQDKAKVGGVFSADLYERLVGEFMASLSPEDTAYLLRNTNLRPVPQALFAILPAKTRARIQRSEAARRQHGAAQPAQPAQPTQPTPAPPSPSPTPTLSPELEDIFRRTREAVGAR